LELDDKTRVFIALELNPNIRKKIDNFSRPFRIDLQSGIRWMKPESIHLTLKFLGDATTNQIKSISDILDTLVRELSPVSVEISGIGAFPSWARPRVIWAGVIAPPVLSEIYKKVDFETVSVGFRSGGSSFSPHLTLARISDHAETCFVTKFSRALQALPPIEFGNMLIDHLVLFKSTLQPGGATYTPISIHPFRGSS
jgi:2'-5' RNA ligase